ncbi:hypothetical protein TNCV_554501 [Trichonephila clavipes]|nr:hypothetical protein TNCV_554501 [Trichonephila clavipes]
MCSTLSSRSHTYRENSLNTPHSPYLKRRAYERTLSLNVNQRVLSDNGTRTTNQEKKKGQVARTRSELVPSLLTTTPHQREDFQPQQISCASSPPTLRVFSGPEYQTRTNKLQRLRDLYRHRTWRSLDKTELGDHL